MKQPDMHVGDVVESSMWVTGDESKELRERYMRDVCEAIDQICNEQGFEHGPVIFIEKRPGEHRVPEVPDHIQGQRVRLLVGESEIVSKRVLSSQGSFVAQLEKKDLERLRTITRRAWSMQHPKDLLTDKQCDDYIEQLGPDTAVEMIRAQYHTLQ